MTLPVPSFVDRPLPYLVCYLLVIAWLCLWPFNFLQSNQVAWVSGGGLKFSPPATAYTSAPPAKLAGLREWTILMDLKALPPWRQGRIFCYSLDEHRCNLNVDQLFDDIVLRVRTSDDQRPREIRVEKLFEQSSERRFVLAIVYDGSYLSVYVDGERTIRQKIGAIDHAAWNNMYPLVLGSHADGKFGWKGIFYQLAVLDRPSTSEALKNPHALFQDTTAVLRYIFDERNGTTVVDHSGKAPATLIWPAKFDPYRLTVLQSPRDYWPDPRRPFVRDIFANIALYLPIGYLISSMVRQRYPTAFAMVVPFFSGMFISFVIEVLQAYLPTRYSSTMDVIVNSLGAGIGGLAQYRGWAEKALSLLKVSFRQSA
jgi:VanZ family protein